MAMNEGKKAFVAGEALLARTLVKLDASTGKVVYADAGDQPIGVNEFAVGTGEVANVILLNVSGTQELRAAGVISRGADVYLADDGEIRARPSAAGSYRKIGVALEASAADQNIIEVLIDGRITTSVEAPNHVAGETLLVSTLVKLDASTGKVVYADAADTAVLGVTTAAAAAADAAVPVAYTNTPGPQQVRAAGAITRAADVYLANDGEIQALPAVNGTYLRIGIALEAAAEDQDIISVLLDDCRTLTTVNT